MKKSRIILIISIIVGIIFMSIGLIMSIESNSYAKVQTELKAQQIEEWDKQHPVYKVINNGNEKVFEAEENGKIYTLTIK